MNTRTVTPSNKYAVIECADHYIVKRVVSEQHRYLRDCKSHHDLIASQELTSTEWAGHILYVSRSSAVQAIKSMGGDV